MAIFGVLFSIYLTLLELFVIHAVCMWCLTSAFLTTLIMLIVVAQLTRGVATEGAAQRRAGGGSLRAGGKLGKDWVTG
jgi:uncharacterized membrane protein